MFLFHAETNEIYSRTKNAMLTETCSELPKYFIEYQLLIM